MPTGRAPGREETRWTLSPWWIRRSPCCAADCSSSSLLRRCPGLLDAFLRPSRRGACNRFRSRIWAQIEDRADVHAHGGHHQIRTPAVGAKLGSITRHPSVRRLAYCPTLWRCRAWYPVRGHPPIGGTLAPISTSTILRRACPRAIADRRVRASCSLPSSVWRRATGPGPKFPRLLLQGPRPYATMRYTSRLGDSANSPDMCPVHC